MSIFITNGLTWSSANLKSPPHVTFTLNNETIKQVEKFKYLGSTITSDGRNDTEIKIRIGMAKDAFQKMEKVIKNKNITIETILCDI